FTIDRLDAGDEVTWTVTYTNPAPGPDGRIVNAAEIESFADVAGTSSSDPGGPQDIDSTPDSDFGDDPLFDDPTALDPADSHNDIGRDHDGDGDVNEPDPGDEDDHDAEAVAVGFDLALRKTVDTGVTPSPVERGDDVTFEIEVINQGARSVQAVDVTDTFDLALWAPFSTAANPDGSAVDTGDGDTIDYAITDDGGGTLTIELSGDALDPGESVVVPLVLGVRADLTAAATLENLAEISRFDDDTDPGNGDSTDPDPSNPIQDLDSTPNADPDDDGIPIDDEIDGTRGGNPNDEDDHDPAEVTVQLFDLALRKRAVDVSPTPPVAGTTKVTFEIEVFNQGSINATDVEITDYVQDGFTFLAADNQNTPVRNTPWTGADGDTAVTTVVPLVFAGRSVVVDIVLTMDAGDDPTERFNYAEISAADDDGNVSTPPPTDVDSVPDATNDEVGDSYEDDEIDEDALTPGPDTSGDGTVDEDDHDGAVVELPIFDLALRKVIDESADNVLAPGGDVTFTIEVHNQGELEANDIDIVDYLPDGLTVSPADTNGWTGTSGNVTITIAGPLAPGASTSVDLVARIGDDVVGELVNAAEITEAEDENDIPRDDVDSEPNDDPSDDDDPVDDEIDNGGGDEDDHDIERFEILPSSLGDTVWIDIDRDGVQDDGEPGVADVTVELLDADGNVLDETTTDADGRYGFTELTPG
ncbi:MAG: SdrD B-like domain-containing protein, partial [Actinomycetota bacterium]